MIVTAHVDQRDSHAHVRIFVGGALAGRLVMRTAEWETLSAALDNGLAENLHAYQEHDHTEGT